MDVAPTGSDNIISSEINTLFQGEVCFIIGHNYTHMGSECEGFSLRLLGQTIVYCHVYTHIGNSLWEVLNLLQFS